jgi:hypothetical protein
MLLKIIFIIITFVRYQDIVYRKCLSKNNIKFYNDNCNLSRNWNRETRNQISKVKKNSDHFDFFNKMISLLMY